MAADVGEDAARRLVALVREPHEPVRVRGRPECVLRRARGREAGDVRLEVPAPRAPPLARPPVVDDDDVSELDAAAGRAGERPSVRDHPAAEPCSEREHDDVVDPAGRAHSPLGDRGCVRVVVDPDRQPEPLDHVVAQRKVVERKVDHVVRPASHEVERSGHAHPDRGHVVAEHFGDGRLELGDERLLGLERRDPLVPAQDFAIPCDDPGEDLRPAEVDADRVRIAHRERVP